MSSFLRNINQLSTALSTSSPRSLPLVKSLCTRVIPAGTSQVRHVTPRAGIQEDLMNRADRVLKGLVLGQPARFMENLLALEDIHQIVDLGNEEEEDIFSESLEELVM
jgi:hypothetical protein